MRISGAPETLIGHAHGRLLQGHGNGAAGSGGTIENVPGSAVWFVDVTDVELVDMVLQNNANSGIAAISVDGQILTRLTVDGNGALGQNVSNQSGMDLVRATGQWVFTDVSVSNSAATNLRLVQVDEAVDLQVLGGSLDAPGPQPYENVFFGDTGGASSITALFRGTSFSNAPRGIDAGTSGPSSIDLTVDGGSSFSEHTDRAMQLRTNGAGSTFTVVVDQVSFTSSGTPRGIHADAAAAGSVVDLTVTGSTFETGFIGVSGGAFNQGQVAVTVSGSSFTDYQHEAIRASSAGAGADFVADIANNVVDGISVGSRAIRVVSSDDAGGVAVVDGNTITNAVGRGILAEGGTGQAGNTGSLQVTISNNLITPTPTTSFGIQVESFESALVCANVHSNTVNFVTGTGGIDITQNQSSTFQVQDLVGSTAAAAVSHLGVLNPATSAQGSSINATEGAGSSEATCSTP